MGTTASERAAAVEGLRPVVGQETKANDLEAAKDALQELVLLDSDVPLYLVRLLKEQIRAKVVSAQGHASTITAALLAMPPTRVPPPDVSGLSVLARRLNLVRTASSVSASKRVAQARTAARDVVTGIGAVSGGDLVPGDQETYQTVKVALEGLASDWADILAWAPQIQQVLPECSGIESARPARAATLAAAALPDIQGDAAASPKKASLALLAISSALSTAATVRDPLAAKGAGTAVASGTPTQVVADTGTRSAPFEVTAAVSAALSISGTATTWEIPASTRAVLTTGEFTSFDTGASPTTLGLMLNGTTAVSVALGPGVVTRAAFSAAIDAVSGLSSAVAGSAVTMTSDRYGETSSIRITAVPVTVSVTGGALGLAVSLLAQGTNVSVSALLQVLPSGMGLRAPVVERATVSLVSGGSTTVLVSSSSGIGAGDKITIPCTPPASYRVVSIPGATSLILDYAPPSGNYTARAYSQRLTPILLAPGISTYLTLPSGLTGLGLSAGTYRGQARQVTASGTYSPAPRRYDVVRGASDTSILSVSGSALQVSAVQTDYEEDVEIYALGATRYHALTAGMVAWRTTVDDGPYASGIKVLVQAAMRAMTRKAGSGVARDHLTALGSSLTTVASVLGAYDAARLDSVDKLLASVKDRGMGRARDRLRLGYVAEFLAMTTDETTYQGYAQLSAAALASDFPLPRGVDLTSMMEEATEDADWDAQYGIENDSSDAMMAEDDDDSEVVY